MRILLCGFGTVAQSLSRLLLSKEEELSRRHGMVPRVVGIIDSRSAVLDDRGVSISAALRTKSRTRMVGSPKKGETTAEIIRRVDADVVVETTITNFQTGEPGISHIRGAFQTKKSVVTANKGPLSVAFHALMELAHYNGVYFRFSGAVGGGTPVLDFGSSCAKGDRITGIVGILNSTSNYVLTSMETDGLGYEQAIALAQKDGYAEADPSLDVNGFDSAVKLVIIANFLMGRNVTVKDVKVTGIGGVTRERLDAAQRRGRAVRLIAQMGHTPTVGPVEIARSDPLCISGPLNAVKFICENTGEKVIVGKGAGGVETATSILRDLIDVRGLLGGRM